MTDDAVLRVPPQVLRILVGMVFAFSFFDNIAHHNCTSAGCRRLIEHYLARGTAPGPWKDVMRFAARHSAVFAPTQAVGEASLAIFLLAGPHVRPMDFTGRPVTSMVLVEPAGLRGAALRRWVEKAATFARTLPPKG